MLTQHDISAHVTRNPEVLRGKPIIRGTRIAVSLIVDWVDSGVSIEQILDDYPNLTLKNIEAALAYSQLAQARTEVRC